MRSFLCGICAVVVAAMPARAQVVTAAQCSAGAAFVNGKPLPAVTDSTFSVWYGLASCDTAGETAAVQALYTASVVSETDSARVQEFMTLFYGRRTTAFFNALQAAIVNSQASDVFRREAIRLYGGLYLPGYDFDNVPVMAQIAGGCGVARNPALDATGPLSNLPSNFLIQMVTTMSTVAANAANATSVRGLAQCWNLTLQKFIPAVGSKILLAYVCGDNFQVTNNNSTPVQVAIDVIPPNARQQIEHFGLTVQPGAVLPFQTLIDHGTARLSFNGTVLAMKTNGGTVCH